jgi:hypothetical protein
MEMIRVVEKQTIRVVAKEGITVVENEMKMAEEVL